MYFLLLMACESMESSGHIFTPVQAPAPAAAAPVAAAPVASSPAAGSGAAPGDPDWSFPATAPEVISSEEMQKVEEGKAEGPPTTDLFGNPVSAAEPAPAEVAAPAPVPAMISLPQDPWPVRLVATLPNAQPPRAVLGLASGEERVVSPGSILADQGLVVVSVTQDRVQLAKVESAGDHARITSLELSAQYPTGPR